MLNLLDLDQLAPDQTLGRAELYHRYCLVVKVDHPQTFHIQAALAGKQRPVENRKCKMAINKRTHLHRNVAVRF